MKMRPMALMTSTRAPFLASISATPRPGVPAGKLIGRSSLRRALDEDQRLLLVPGMIAGGDGVGAGVDELLVDRLGDAEAAGGVLAIDGDEIELPVAHQPGQALEHDGAPAASHDVADEQGYACAHVPGNR